MKDVFVFSEMTRNLFIKMFLFGWVATGRFLRVRTLIWDDISNLHHEILRRKLGIVR